MNDEQMTITGDSIPTSEIILSGSLPFNASPYPPLKVKKLYPDAQLPVRAKPDDAGLDVCIHHFDKLYSGSGVFDQAGNMESLILEPNERVLVSIGLAVAIPSGYEIQVRPRSGNALKRGLTIMNSPGTIDAAYRGAVGIIVVNLGMVKQKLLRGEKIAQLVVKEVVLSDVIEVKELDETLRGTDGFGSTGI